MRTWALLITQCSSLSYTWFEFQVPSLGELGTITQRQLKSRLLHTHSHTHKKTKGYGLVSDAQVY
jgi:hypothetical protein